MDYKNQQNMLLRHIISFPFIWIMLIPLILFDLCLEIYHRICFALYGIPFVSRSSFIRIDRHRLSYLSIWDKLNCMYCGYANGLLQYGAQVAGDTEKYWCGIKHAQYEGFHVPLHHKDFLEYGDEEGFRKKCKLEKRE
jgi:hypothetical protein